MADFDSAHDFQISFAVRRRIARNDIAQVGDKIGLAAMGAKEGAMILDLVARLREEGRVSIIMIAHNYVHVLQSCDRVNLIQDGEITFDKPTADTSVEELNEIVVEEYRRARIAVTREGAA